ncbi:hypothetical protein [Streptomyces sp. NRRL S-340]|uniref:hypothetical protein n=1 Tax=Streptomyces sp. NRRL S-340 TaxID=1463901 RepID=UPI00055BA888|nr:hypothetical protein [Streptomyces sp. NRRL S-340]
MHAFVLDLKRISHTWTRGVPGVTFCRDIAEINDALIRLAQEGRRRLAPPAEQLADCVLRVAREESETSASAASASASSRSS